MGMGPMWDGGGGRSSSERRCGGAAGLVRAGPPRCSTAACP